MKRVLWGELRHYEFPEKTDTAFREELSWLALTGFRVIAAIKLSSPMMVLIVQLFGRSSTLFTKPV